MNFKKPGRPRLRDPYLACDLDHRVQIMKKTRVGSSLGGIEDVYTTIKTIWGGIRPIKEGARVRYQSIEKLKTVTHQFIFRRLAIIGLDGSTALMPLSDSHYLKVEYGDTATGRIFRVRGVVEVESKKEFFRVMAEEIEEVGTGAYSASY